MPLVYLKRAGSTTLATCWVRTMRGPPQREVCQPQGHVVAHCVPAIIRKMSLAAGQLQSLNQASRARLRNAIDAAHRVWPSCAWGLRPAGHNMDLPCYQVQCGRPNSTQGRVGRGLQTPMSGLEARWKDCDGSYSTCAHTRRSSCAAC
jgi:hypothetical protein